METIETARCLSKCNQLSLECTTFLVLGVVSSYRLCSKPLISDIFHHSDIENDFNDSRVGFHLSTFSQLLKLLFFFNF